MTFAEMIDWLTGRKRAYMRIPDEVIEDLALFCRARETPVVVGDRDRTMLLLGRNEVWHRIMQHRRHTPEQLYALYGGVVPKEQSK